MPTIHLEAQVSGDELLRAVEQLSPPEFEQFVARVLALRAGREAPILAADEAPLLLRVGRGLPETLRRRFEELAARRADRTLTPEEHAELIRLTDEVETRERDRLEALAELARVRRVPLGTLMADLGIEAPSHGG